MSLGRTKSFQIDSARNGHFRNAICNKRNAKTKRKHTHTNEKQNALFANFLDRNVLRMIGVRVASFNVGHQRWKKKQITKIPNTKWPSRILLITKCRNRTTWSNRERYPLVLSFALFILCCFFVLFHLLFEYIEIKRSNALSKSNYDDRRIGRTHKLPIEKSLTFPNNNKFEPFTIDLIVWWCYPLTYNDAACYLLPVPMSLVLPTYRFKWHTTNVRTIIFAFTKIFYIPLSSTLSKNMATSQQQKKKWVHQNAHKQIERAHELKKKTPSTATKSNTHMCSGLCPKWPAINCKRYQYNK